MALALALPSQVIELIQQGALERAFHDGLFPELLYRAEALWEEWPANTGQEQFITRPGLLPPVTKPLAPGTDPTPSEVPYEQWSALLGQFADAIDTHMPTATVQNANTFLRNIHQQGLQSGQSVNRIARNALFGAYLGGHTATIAVGVAADTTIRVANLSGFRDVVTVITVRPQTVSPSFPLPITIPTIGARNVIGAIPDDPNDPTGPGTLQLDVALGAGLAVRNPVLANNRSQVLRSGGGNSVDAIAAADTLVLQDMITAAGVLRTNNIKPHDDGYYHAHISPLGNTQVFADEAFQRLNTALPEHDIYKTAFIGTLVSQMFMENTESPNVNNTGAQVFTGPNLATSGSDIGAETVNDTGIPIGRVLVTGKGSLYERSLDESLYTTEAGITGKIGEFDVVNAGVQIITEHIRLIIRAPLDRLQQKVGSAWSISTAFPVPSDVTAPTSPARYKRAIVVEYAEGTP